MKPPVDGGPSCRCDHSAAHHDHYRSGTDCGTCDCPAYWPTARARIRAWLHR